jgi:pimeloyl-ACP methyl ester carboxylesterase
MIARRRCAGAFSGKGDSDLGFTRVRHSILPKIPPKSAAVAVALALFAVAAEAEPIAPGSGEQTADLAGTDFVVYTYRPKDCADPSLLLVFHGLGRNVAGYRDAARDLADDNCMLVVAPLFDEKRFPAWRYQRGGIVKAGVIQKPSEWTGNIVIDLADWVRKQERRELDYSLIGHSAGGQFLSRVAAFVPTQARRIVIANPSTHVVPSLKVDAPFGFGGVYAGATGQAQLRRYLEQPVTIFLGEEDTDDKDLSETREAMAQGETRLERGLNVYQQAKKLAASRNWTFNWRLVEVPGVGHSARKMFRSPEALDALKP